MKQDIGCLMALGLIVGALCIAYALAPTAVVLAGWTGATGLLWWKVSRKIDNLTGPVKEPVPSPIELGPEDYVSADGGTLFRKREAPLPGYDVVQLKAPVDADTSPGRAD